MIEVGLVREKGEKDLKEMGPKKKKTTSGTIKCDFSDEEKKSGGRI